MEFFVQQITQQFALVMKRKRVGNKLAKYAIFGDIKFPRKNPSADYDSKWDKLFTDRKLISVTHCYESSILFSAREGWVNSKALLCSKAQCTGKNRTRNCS